MMKKLLTLLMAIILVFALCSCGDTTGTTDTTTPDDTTGDTTTQTPDDTTDDTTTTTPTEKKYVLTYTVDGNNATITGLTNDTEAETADVIDGHLVIPETIDGYTVNAIGVADAWDGSDFYSGYFTEVTLPSTLTYIAESAFQECYTLTTVNFAASGSSLVIGGYAFTDTMITSLTIPAYVTDIGQCAFSGCSSLKTVEFLGSTPPTLGRTNWGTDINAYGTFMGCSWLESVTVPSGCAETYKSAYSTYYGIYDYISDDPDSDDSYWVDKIVEKA